MGKAARIKKKKSKSQLKEAYVSAIDSVPSFTIVLDILNDLLSKMIALEEKIGTTESLDKLVKTTDSMIDPIYVEVKKRVDEHNELVEKYKKEYKDIENNPLQPIKALNDLATRQVSNIYYLKENHPIYKDEFCNLLTLLKTEEGKKDYEELKNEVNTFISNTTAMLATFQLQ